MKFPPDWQAVRLKDIVLDMQPGFAQRPGEDGSIGQIRTHNVTPDGRISLKGLKKVNPSETELNKYSLQPGDIIFNNTNSEEWVGKTALYEENTPLTFSNHMTRIRVNNDLIIPSFLSTYLHFLWKIGFSRTRAKRWVSQAGIDQQELLKFEIPLPSLQEQQRIVDILKQADELRRLRQNILEKTKQLPSALFLEMFGDPHRNDNKWDTELLGNICQVVGGGTPSKERSDFWNGDIPWISPKDMTKEFISNSEDHISKEAIKKSATHLIPKGSILVVTRSGILKHTLPCALSTTDVTINQDIKAFVPKTKELGFFLLYQLMVLAPLLLRRVRVGATVHNLETNFLAKLRIILPPVNLQKKFYTIIDKIVQSQCDINNAIKSSYHLDRYFVTDAFSGELTYSWRQKNRESLEQISLESTKSVKRPRNKVTFTEEVPEERPWLNRKSRSNLYNQLGEIQRYVFQALRKWKSTLIPSEDLDDFIEQSFQIAHLEDASDQIKHALNQLAGLGLIAKISLPNNAGKYVTGYRGLREDELTKASDINFITRKTVRQSLEQKY